MTALLDFEFGVEPSAPNGRLELQPASTLADPECYGLTVAMPLRAESVECPTLTLESN